MSRRPRRASRQPLPLASPDAEGSPGPRPPSEQSQPGASLCDTPEAPRSPWSWGRCAYCFGQGWVTRPEWLLAWLHPAYPDLAAVEEAMRESLGGVALTRLPVREPCVWCSGAGRRYGLPGG